MKVYQIINKINGKKYVGITSNLDERFSYHKTRSFQPKHKEYEKPLYRAFRKYGLENFTFEVLMKDLTVEEAKQKEINFIAEFNSTTHENGYNVTRGGDYNSAFGEEHHNSILTEKEAKDIIDRRIAGEERAKVFHLYKDKLSFHGFSNVWQGRTWAHINPEFSNRKKSNVGVNNANSIFTVEEVVLIRTKKKEGANRLDLYNGFRKKKECSEAAFNRIWYNYTYKNIKV